MSLSEPAADTAAFITQNLDLAEVTAIPQFRMYQAQPSSGLWRLAEQEEGGFGAPYWAYQWAGGLALARYFLDRPEAVAGKRVVDLGAGGGVVSLAAARAGAASVTAVDIDPYAVSALRLNAEANGAALTILGEDITAGPAPDADILAVGDLFYDEETARPVVAFMERCLEAGLTVLAGDPGRKFLPRARLRLLAEYDVSDVGRLSQKAGAYAFIPG